MNQPIHTVRATEFETQYVFLRRKEGRIYTDDELKALPKISSQHALAKEWKVRASSCQKLCRYIASPQKQLKILEIGCGNGWLSNRLATCANAEITATDINLEELEQARRVFHSANINFLHGSIGDNIFSDQKFDLIVFASSIQYFPSLSKTLKTSMSLLNPGGEIHILDTNFYKAREKVIARLRSREYFEKAGVPLMQNFYYHHSLQELAGLQFEFLNRLSFWLDKASGKKAFPWIRIKKQVC